MMAERFSSIAGKLRECQFQDIAQKAEREGEWAPSPCFMSDYHARDESFHTATSQILSHDLQKDFTMSKNDKLWSNIMLFGSQKVDCTLSAAVPLVFRSDEPFMPYMYRVLRSRLFNMDHEKAMSMLEKSLCQETQGMYELRDTHKRVREDSLKYVADLEHLWPANRELRRMATPSIEETVRNNRSAFKRFKAQMDKELAAGHGPVLGSAQALPN